MAATAQQASIQPQPSGKEWLLSAGEMSYVVGVNDENKLQSLYWGPHLASVDGLPPAKMHAGVASFDPPIAATPLEYPAWGTGLPYEPAIKVSFPNGNRSLALVFDKAEQHGTDTLEVTLRDISLAVYVHVFYQVYPQGVLARWATIENKTDTTMTLANAASGIWNLPPNPRYNLRWLTGRWAGEWQLQQEAIRPGERVLESRRGTTGSQSNPWFAVGEAGLTSEEHGPVWFGELGWSGSWRVTVDENEAKEVRITGGYNSFDFSYPLAPGQSLTTPKFYGGYSSHGQGEASRILHRFQEGVILPQAPNPKPRPVLYNSWEATYFNVTEQGQEALADRASKLGVERFVIDDGWFGQRNNDHAGLGDWYVNPQKFPHGLKPLIDHVHSLGMNFGIWVEPEAVNPDSDLYRKHPDWAMNFPGRPRSEERNQLMLNLARPDVREYVFHWLDELVSNNQINFLKWDYNRNWSEPGWTAVPLAEQQTIYVKYIENLYWILSELRKKHPGLEIESCSGGGARVDLGILRYTDEVWPSDNTDALDRLTIQDGFTQAYSPGIMMAWVTDVPNFNDRITPLQFRFDVAMSGSLGIGGNLNKWTDEEMKQAAADVAFYKTIRTTVQQGSLYRLTRSLNGDDPGFENPASQLEQGRWASEYVSQDGRQVAVFAFLHAQHFGEPFPAVRLEGLDPDATYRITARDAKKADGVSATASGAVLMGEGLHLTLKGDYDSTVVVLAKQ